ncbi:MAG: cytochrome bc complex cytochrome b subunit [Actinobacteria bacterium]|nr:MAG: cytochrome bc complex cytochrome b subunit [Actinomycetota bacterium]
MIRRATRFLDERAGAAPFLRKALRYVFPDHWSFLLGEIALYSFVVLVLTGIYLTLFFEPSLKDTVYHGSYEPLQGQKMSEAYRSVVDISFKVNAGLLIRQTHHWAADVFVVAIVLHLLRVFFTGAFRKPRDYSVVMSVPIVGASLAVLVWGAGYPGIPSFEGRMYIAHVFLLPIAIAVLLSLHLLLVVARHHTQFPGPKRTERRVVGLPMVPGYVPRTLGLALAVAAVLVLLGGLVQINPIWQWGPYSVANGTNGAQPDWYLGWLIGALRLMPGFDVTIGDYTLVPNPFWGGVLFPMLVFAFLFAWPTIERRRTDDRDVHNLLDHPSDMSWRTAVGASVFSFVAVVFLAGSMDRIAVSVGVPYTWQIWIFRAGLLVVPPLVFVVTRRICSELSERKWSEVEPSMARE